jgi:hypothetical protein
MDRHRTRPRCAGASSSHAPDIPLADYGLTPFGGAAMAARPRLGPAFGQLIVDLPLPEGRDADARPRVKELVEGDLA